MKRAAASLLALFLSALAMAGGERRLSTAIYPPQVLPVSFSHARHQSREAVPCERCHVGATTSRVTRDDLMPRQAACEGCHAIDPAHPEGQAVAGKAGGACVLCHPGWNGQGQPARVLAPEAALKFSHALHADKQVGCERCHGSMAGVGLATRNQLPTMAECQSCHDGKAASSRCATCHLTEASGRLRTTLPGGSLVPADHGVDYARQHGTAGRMSAETCASCHSERFCVECHDGKLKPLTTHAGDYARAHAVDARKDSKTCASCHRVETFCTGCHSRSGVMADARTGAFPVKREGAPAGSPRFHPEGFSTGTARGGRTAQHHAFAAQRNLAACASCHREDFCAGCHRAPGAIGTGGISPHGPAWRASARCRAIESKNPRVCLRCHLDDRDCN